MFSIEAIPCLTALPLQARLGLLFLFLPFFCLPVLSPAWMGLAFSHPGLPLSWIRSQLAHTGPTGRVCCFAGVVSLPGCQNRTRRHTGASLVFLPRTSLPLPLKGEGRDFVHLWSFGFSLAVACGNCWSQLAQQGRSRALLVSLPYPTSKIAHRATQGRVWFHRLFLVRFFCGSPANCRSRW